MESLKRPSVQSLLDQAKEGKIVWGKIAGKFPTTVNDPKKKFM